MNFVSLLSAGPLGGVVALGNALAKPVIAKAVGVVASPVVSMGDPNTPSGAQGPLSRSEFTTLAVGLLAALTAGTTVYLIVRK